MYLRGLREFQQEAKFLLSGANGEVALDEITSRKQLAFQRLLRPSRQKLN